MEVPPDALHGIALGRVLGKEVDGDSVPPARKILLDGAALVEGGVIADDVDFSIAPQAPPQVVEEFSYCCAFPAG